MSSLHPGTCAVCGASDARLLCEVQLVGGSDATLCGSHALMHLRFAQSVGSIERLREKLGDRRRGERRDDYDVLAAAFSNDRRGPSRRRPLTLP